jgi:putative transposase
MSGRYRKSAHVIYECKYHICWLPKYRYPILTGEIAVRELIRQIAQADEVEIISGAMGSDHVHLYVSIPPSLSVAKFIQFMKGATSRKIQQEFDIIRKRDDMVRDYIRRHGDMDTYDDEFKISEY